MRFRKIWWGSWWGMKEWCEIPRCLLRKGLRCPCPMYNVSSIFYDKCLYFSHYMAGYLLDRPCIPRSGITGSKADPFLIWGVSLYCFPQWLYQSAIPPTMQKCSPFSTSSPALVVYWFIDDGHSDWCEVISHCSFNLHFSDDQRHRASFHMSIGHLYVLFGEVSIQVLCLFFNWVVCFFGVEFC